MPVYYKIAGTWTVVDRPYIKINNVQVPVKEVWVKRSGSWQQAYEFDETPPDPPVVSLEIVETSYWEEDGRIGTKKTGRHVKVGVRSPGVSHDEDLKLIRVLSTYNGKAPTTQYGGTYTSKSDEDFPDEPWSDFSFNGHNDSGNNKDSSVYHYKEWPRNANTSSQLEGQTTMHFTAWSQDLNGNWSTATAASIFIPKKSADGSEVIVKEARFQANNGGSHEAGGLFTPGQLVQASGPSSIGMWFYGNQITDNVGKQGPANIRNAQIYVSRVDDDGGAASANIYLYWHDYGSTGAISGNINRRGTTKVGTLAKGEAKWFDLPATMIEKLESRELKGFGLHRQDPDKASAFANDFSKVKSLTDDLRSGEVHVVWTEKP